MGDSRANVAEPFLTELCRDLNCFVLSINYRLAPEHPFPTGLLDCYSVLVALNEGTIEAMPPNADTKRVVLIGESAGGNLAAAVSMLWRDKNVRGNVAAAGGQSGREAWPQLGDECVPRTPQVVVVHQVVIYPCFYQRPLVASRTDPSMQNAYIVKPWVLEMHEAYYTPWTSTPESMAACPYVNCASATDFDSLPAVTGCIGGADILRDEGFAFFRKVEQGGGDIEWRQWDKSIHGFFFLPGGGGGARNAQGYVKERLRDAFAGQDS